MMQLRFKYAILSPFKLMFYPEIEMAMFADGDLEYIMYLLFVVGLIFFLGRKADSRTKTRGKDEH